MLFLIHCVTLNALRGALMRLVFIFSCNKPLQNLKQCIVLKHEGSSRMRRRENNVIAKTVFRNGYLLYITILVPF